VSPYVERLRPSPAFWLLVPVAAVLAGSSAVPLGIWVSVAAGVAAGAMVAVLLGWRAPELRVDTDGFRAGVALLDPPSIGDVEALDRDLTRVAMGPDLRADAYVLHRGWVATAVRVGVEDDADPTPYWLVSTRRPVELAAALEECRRPRGSDQAAHSEQTG